MNIQTNDYFAKKLRQNWLTRYQDLKTEKDQEDDDSLTNLSWLQNINLTKMAIPGTPLSPVLPTSWQPMNKSIVKDEYFIKTGVKAPVVNGCRNTLELYRQHCNSYGFNTRQNEPIRVQNLPFSYLGQDSMNLSQSKLLTKQHSSWWKMKGNRTICRNRTGNHTPVKYHMRNNAAMLKPTSIKDVLTSSIGSFASFSVEPGNCYPITHRDNTQTFFTMAPSNEEAFPVTSKTTFSSNYVSKCKLNENKNVLHANEHIGIKDDSVALEEIPVATTLPTVNDITLSQREVYRKNQSIRPPFSYTILIYMSIEATQKTKITLNEIYSWIAENFAFYRNSEPAWKLALRQTLIWSTYFQRVPRRKEEPGGWGDLWRLNPEIRTQMTDALQRKMSLQKLTNDTDTITNNINCGINNTDSFCNRETNEQVQSPKGDYWTDKFNSGSSSSPSSIDVYTPTSQDQLKQQTSPKVHNSRLLDYVTQDVTLLENTLNEIQPKDISDLREIDSLLLDDSHNVVNLFKDYRSGYPSPSLSESSIQKVNTTANETCLKQSSDWWPDHFTDNLTSTHSYLDNIINKTLHIDSLNQASRNNSMMHFPDLQMDYSISASTTTSDELPWVDDRLNLEELDSILGLN